MKYYTVISLVVRPVSTLILVSILSVMGPFAFAMLL